MTTSSVGDESKARRLAARVGLRVKKSRSAMSIDNLGDLMLVDAKGNFVVAGERFDWSAQDVIDYCQEQLKVKE